jgi:DEAD_2
MVRLGKKYTACPYYLTKELQVTADVVFMPYNYLVDPEVRRNLTISLADSVLIFDEAHNLEAICGDAASFDLTTGTDSLLPSSLPPPSPFHLFILFISSSFHPFILFILFISSFSSFSPFHNFHTFHTFSPFPPFFSSFLFLSFPPLFSSSLFLLSFPPLFSSFLFPFLFLLFPFLPPCFRPFPFSLVIHLEQLQSNLQRALQKCSTGSIQ